MGKVNFFGILFILIMVSTGVHGQEVMVRGSVFDSKTAEGLAAAYLTFGDQGTTTDLEGNFSIFILPGEYRLQCTYVGYSEYSQSISISGAGLSNLQIALDPAVSMLETATVTSSKFEKPLGEVTVSLEVLQPRLIENTNATSVDEALEKIPGLTISDGQADIRGGSGWSYGAGSRILLMVDNIPALQPDAGIPQWDDLPVENIAQVEVIKGASSALYGSSAMNGIINIRTAYATSTPITKISMFRTSYMKPSIREKAWWDQSPYEGGVSFSHAQKIKKLDLVLGGYGFSRNSFNKETAADYARINTSLRYRLSDRLTMQLNGNFNEGRAEDFFYWRKPAVGEELVGFYEGDPTSPTQTDRTRFFVDPSLTYLENNGNQHRLSGRYFYTDNRSTNNQAQKSQLFYGEYQFQKQLDAANLTLTSGLVASHTASISQLFSDTTFSINNAAIYLQADKKFGSKLNVSAGFRFERNAILGPDSIPVGPTILAAGDATESKPVFRLGLNYQATAGTFIRASWGQGYRFPTLAEKFINTNAGGIVVVPNPTLSSETGWSAEIGIKQGFRAGKFEGFFDFAGYLTEYSDMMEFTFSGDLFAFQSQNIGNTRISGLDFTLAGRGQIGEVQLNIYGGYNLINPLFKEFDDSDPKTWDPRNLTEGQLNNRSSTADYNILKYRRKHNAKFDIEAVYQQWLLGFTGNYGSNIEAIDAFLDILNGIAAYREANNRGFRTLDMRIAHHISKQVKVSFLMRNIFNEEYTRRPGLLEAPANWTIRLDIKP